MTIRVEAPPGEIKFTTVNDAINCPELKGYINTPILHSIPTFLDVIRTQFQEILTGMGKPTTLETYKQLEPDEKDEIQTILAINMAEEIGIYGMVTMFRPEAREQFNSELSESLSHDQGTTIDDYTSLQFGREVKKKTTDLDLFYHFVDSWSDEAKNLALQIALEQQIGIYQKQLKQEQTDSNRKRPNTIAIYQKDIANLTSVQSRLPIP